MHHRLKVTNASCSLVQTPQASPLSYLIQLPCVDLLKALGYRSLNLGVVDDLVVAAASLAGGYLQGLGLEPSCVSVCPTDALQFMNLEEARKMAAEAEANGLYTYGVDEVGGTSWIYISDVPFSEFGLPEYSTVTQKGFQTGILVKFAGAGLLVGAAILAAVKLYAERREAIMKSEREGGN